MDLNTFTIDQLPFQTSDTLPEFCVRHKVDLGKVPDEKDNTNPVYYMDEIFAAGSEQPVPPTPVGPADNEIWYWGEYYDLANAISILGQQMPYVGPSILSNEQVGDKYVITFDGPVTKLGANMETNNLYPLFMNNPEMGISCNITKIEIPNSVISIGSMAFLQCVSLTSITIPNNVASIEGPAFWGCVGLTSITIPNGITSIGERTFEFCIGLTSITIPNSVINIGVAAFQECRGLTSITIPNSVINIGGAAFYNCNSLISITCEAITPPILDETNVFGDTNNCPIYVQADSVEAYKVAENWSEYADRIQAIQ